MNSAYSQHDSLVLILTAAMNLEMLVTMQVPNIRWLLTLYKVRVVSDFVEVRITQGNYPC